MAQRALGRTKMRGMLVQQGLVKALMGRSKMPETMSEEEKEEMDEKALSAIQLCLADEVLTEVLEETTAKGCGSSWSLCT